MNRRKNAKGLSVIAYTNEKKASNTAGGLLDGISVRTKSITRRAKKAQKAKRNKRSNTIKID
jgi:hypothetical protein